ncbi:Axin-1 [Nymphon striatum]|nr:Axin-1 [Nymphon striatum]
MEINDQLFPTEHNNASSLDDGDAASDCTSSVHTGCSTPNYVKWTKSFSTLLNDTHGYALFNQYAKLENFSTSLNFLYAFQGVKLSNDQITLSAIYKTYFASAGASACYGIKDKTRKAVIKYYKEHGIIKDYKVFEPAFKEVEEYMVSTVHPNFIQSDLFLTYVQKKQAGIRTPSEESRGSISPDGAISNAQEFSKEVPVQKHQMDLIPEGSCSATDQVNGQQFPVPLNPYATYFSRVPVTAQTSEKLSRGSGSTDFSKRSGESRALMQLEKKKQDKRMMELASRNRDTNHLEYIPKLDVGVPRTNMISASNPPAFLDYICKKLEEIKQFRDEEERQCRNPHDQDILDSHCSRTWPTDQPRLPEDSFTTPLELPTLSPSTNNVNFSAALSQKVSSSMKKNRVYPSNDRYFPNLSTKDFEKMKMKDHKTASSSSSRRHDINNPRNSGHSMHLNNHIAPQMSMQYSVGLANSQPVSHHTPDQSGKMDEAKLQKIMAKRAKEESIRMKSSEKSLDSVGSRRNVPRASAPAPLQPVPKEQTVAVYRFSPETELFKVKIPGRDITLKQFKSTINKRGKFRIFFKTMDTEFGAGGINEEYSDDHAICPLWEGKICAIIESMD